MDPLDRSMVSVCVCLRCSMCVLARARVCVCVCGVCYKRAPLAGRLSIFEYFPTHTALASTAITFTITSVLQGCDCCLCIRVLKNIVKAHTHAHTQVSPDTAPRFNGNRDNILYYIPPLPNNNNNNRTRKRTLQAYKYT